MVSIILDEICSDTCSCVFLILHPIRVVLVEIEGRIVLQLFLVSETLRKSANYIFLPRTRIF